MFDTPEPSRPIEQIYRYPLLQPATDTLNRQLRSGADDQGIANLVLTLFTDGALCKITDEPDLAEPRIICSLGLFEERATG